MYFRPQRAWNGQSDQPQPPSAETVSLLLLIQVLVWL